MATKMKLELTPDMSDEEIKEVAERDIGVEYVSEICRRCGSFWVDGDAHTDKATILSVCHCCSRPGRNNRRWHC